jgi:hypothetical protein
MSNMDVVNKIYAAFAGGNIPAVLELFDPARAKEFIGKTTGVAGGHLTGTQMAASLTAALGQEVRYNSITPEQCRASGFPGAEDLGNMFQFKRDFEETYCGARNLDLARALNPSLQTFEAWLEQSKNRIPLD